MTSVRRECDANLTFMVRQRDPCDGNAALTAFEMLEKGSHDLQCELLCQSLKLFKNDVKQRKLENFQFD